MKYVLNSYYIIRHDACRTFILGGRNGRVSNGVSVDANWTSMIHPAYAMMLSFFSYPVELERAAESIADFFSINKKSTTEFLTTIIEAKECWHTSMAGFDRGFPKNLIIPEQIQCNPLIRYSPHDFKFTSLNSKSRRMIHSPLSIVWMPNNNCYTACEYCYADRKHHDCIFSREKMESFIKDAAKSGVSEIMISGGDFFENPHWTDILDVLKKEGYNIDMISTKKPLSCREISVFKEYGIRLQLSIDTASESVAQKLLHVKNGYVSRIKETLQMMDELGLDFQVATVLTKLNDRTEDLDVLLAFLSKLNNLRHWEIRVAFRSLYSKTDFDKIKSTRTQINKVACWIKCKQKESSLRILWSPDDDDKYKKAKGGSKNFEGPICAANMTNMIVLPDGTATVCEQLYWNPEFVIGNVFNDSICDIWNSDKALQLWKRQQNTISEKSPCRKCEDFDECFENGNRCFANIIKAYGRENSDYPDPRCHLAPMFINSITYE